MDDIDISALSVASAQDALRRGDFTSVELTQSVLDTIAAKDGAIGATHITAEGNYLNSEILTDEVIAHLLLESNRRELNLEGLLEKLANRVTKA